MKSILLDMAAIKSIFLNLFHSKAFTFLPHLLGLGLFFSIPVLFLGQRLQSQSVADILSTRPYWVFYGCYIFLFYLNSYWLIPRLFLRKKYAAYVGLLALLFAGVYLLKPFDQLVSYVSRRTDAARPDGVSVPAPPPRQAPGLGAARPPLPPGGAVRPGGPPGQNVPVDIVSLFLFVMIVAANLAVETARQWRTTQKRALQAEAGKANAELSFLKAQINPHFLFNTLNNIYSLVVTQNENAGPAILRLSNIMRYVTDEVSADYVPLQQEVNCIRDYIGLQSLRLGKKAALDFDISGPLENRSIAPLILIPFIENVFKYGLSNHEHAPLTVHITIREEQIDFFCQNKIFPNQNTLERAGVGIANTRERLRFLYPDKHRLDITAADGFFTVQLVLLTG
jgi:two-component system LytT family sensor kinase